MSTPKHASSAPEEQGHRTPSRWGVRLRELTKQPSAAAVDPLDWQPKPHIKDRVKRAASVPIAAAAAVFLLVVLASITMVWLQPHGVNSATAEQPKDAVEATEFESSRAGAEKSFAQERASAASDARASGSKKIIVHVIGEVHKPGVYELPQDSRVLDALKSAGGETEAAVLTAVNLARPLSDGEQLSIPDANVAEAMASMASASGAPHGSTAPSAGGAGSGGVVSLNSADAAAFETLPRVGPALAQRIIDWRDANGGFQSVDQLMNVSGIGQKTFEQLRDMVTL